MKQVLIVDDEEAVCWALARALEAEGYRVAVAATAEEGLKLAASLRPQVVFLDVRLPGMDGLTALGRLRQLAPDVAVIVITAFGNLSTAVRAVEGGAFDYLAKPFDLDQALDAARRGFSQETNAQQPDDPALASTPEDEIVGRSPAMQVVFKRIALVAPREACVLISGESGTGKELVARAIHRHSQRSNQTFLPVHIASLNPSLVESELFGHARGAFTGATQSRSGLLALADGGTVFLDELADVPLSVQVKLLRVLEHNEVLPVGSNQPERLNIRVLAATHQDLQELVRANRFRHDLFFRLNVFQIHLPPLRERKDDIRLLAEHFLRLIDPRSLPLRPETIAYLTQLPWLGNVRELRNALEHASILARGGPILPAHFPALGAGLEPVTAAEQLIKAVQAWLEDKVRQARPQAPANLYDDLLHCVEPALLSDVLKRLEGNRWLAAQWLGLNRATVRKKLGMYKLNPPSDKDGTDEEG